MRYFTFFRGHQQHDLFVAWIQIKASFRELARKYHPDKNKHHEQDDRSEKFKRIREAYEVLCNVEKRARFDAGEPFAVSSGGTIAEVDLGTTNLPTAQAPNEIMPSIVFDLSLI